MRETRSLYSNPALIDIMPQFELALTLSVYTPAPPPAPGKKKGPPHSVAHIMLCAHTVTDANGNISKFITLPGKELSTDTSDPQTREAWRFFNQFNMTTTIANVYRLFTKKRLTISNDRERHGSVLARDVGPSLPAHPLSPLHPTDKRETIFCGYHLGAFKNLSGHLGKSIDGKTIYPGTKWTSHRIGVQFVNTADFLARLEATDDPYTLLVRPKEPVSGEAAPPKPCAPVHIHICYPHLIARQTTARLKDLITVKRGLPEIPPLPEDLRAIGNYQERPRGPIQALRNRKPADVPIDLF